MNKNLLMVASVVAVLLLDGYLLSQKNNSTTTSINNQAPTVAPRETVTESPLSESSQINPMERSVDVEIKDFAFNPKTLTIKKGTTVTWTNRDSVKHDVVVDEGSEFRSELLAKGELFTHTFTAAGTFAYHCNPHAANMKATVTVTE